MSLNSFFLFPANMQEATATTSERENRYWHECEWVMSLYSFFFGDSLQDATAKTVHGFKEGKSVYQRECDNHVTLFIFHFFILAAVCKTQRPTQTTTLERGYRYESFSRKWVIFSSVLRCVAVCCSKVVDCLVLWLICDVTHLCDMTHLCVRPNQSTTLQKEYRYESCHIISF